MTFYIKGDFEDKIAFLVTLLVFIVACIVCKIKWWWEDRHEK